VFGSPGLVNEFGVRRCFFGVLVSLINFRVRVLTEGDVQFITGVLTAVGRDFITLAIEDSVAYIPIRQITIIQRVFV
jgi:hypothetical protein